MLCESVLGFLDEVSPGRPTDHLDIAWHETLRRALRRQTRAGREIGILLPRGQRLLHHAIVHESADLRIVVNVIPIDIFIARPNTLADMGKLALELGNLHAPTQIIADALLTLADGPAEEVLDRLRIEYAKSTAVFEPTPVSVAVRVVGDFRVIQKDGTMEAKEEHGANR